MYILRFFFVLNFISLTASVFSQQTISIGENKKIISLVEQNNSIIIGYQDLLLVKKKKPSFYILEDNKKSGPFDTLQCLSIESSEQTKEITPKSISYFSIKENNKEYIIFEKLKYGPFDAAEIVKVTKDRVVIVDYSEKGTYYQIFSTTSKKPVSISKSEIYKDQLTGIYISDNLDVLLSFDDNVSEPSQYFIYEGKKTSGFYHAVHFQGWITTEKNKLSPVFHCIAPIVHEMYDVTNDLYVGNRLIEKIVAILYDFTFNKTNTDFAVKGYTANQDGPRVYSLNTALGPYDLISNLEIDSSNQLKFEYEKDKQWFLYQNSQSTPLSAKEEYDWKNISPYSTDFIKCISNKDANEIYFNDKLIATGKPWNINFLTWTKRHGPVIIEKLLKPAPANPDPNGENWEGEIPDGVKLIINGTSSKKYTSIIDFKESLKGEIAYIAYENDGYYVFREDQKYGPYDQVTTIGKERENFLKWNADGTELFYVAISNQKFHVFQNGKAISSYPTIISFYWNSTFQNSAIVKIKDMACFFESDFYSIPLDSDPFVEEYEQQLQQEFTERYDDLLKRMNCISIQIGEKEYQELGFVHSASFSKNGKVFSFMNLDTPCVIYNNELLNGMIYNDKVVYYKNGDVIVSLLN